MNRPITIIILLLFQLVAFSAPAEGTAVRASNTMGLGPGDRVQLRTRPEEVFQLKEGKQQFKANSVISSTETMP